MKRTIIAVRPTCQCFDWDHKESAPNSLIEAAVKEAGGGFQAYYIKTGYDFHMAIIAPSPEWAMQFEKEWDNAMSEKEDVNPEYITLEAVEYDEEKDALTQVPDEPVF